MGLVEDPPRQLILDLSRLEFISSEGLGAIIAAHVRCRRHQGQMALAAPPPQIRHLLSLTHLNRLLPIQDSVEEAMRQMSQESPE
jgi:anti-anti-sigma factor